jgi:hypothetical protein
MDVVQGEGGKCEKISGLDTPSMSIEPPKQDRVQKMGLRRKVGVRAFRSWSTHGGIAIGVDSVDSCWRSAIMFTKGRSFLFCGNRLTTTPGGRDTGMFHTNKPEWSDRSFFVYEEG